MIPEQKKTRTSLREDLIKVMYENAGISYGTNFPPGFLADIDELEEIAIGICDKLDDNDYMPQGEPVE